MEILGASGITERIMAVTAELETILKGTRKTRDKVARIGRLQERS